MKSEAARSSLLLANVPVALFAAMAMFTGLFGLAAPEPNPARWVAVASPLLLAGWLALGNIVFQADHRSLGLLMLSVPVVLLSGTLFFAIVATS